MRNFYFKFWEKIIIIFAAILIVFSSVVFLTDSTLISQYFFGVTKRDNQVSIGRIARKNGSLRRQFSGDSEFASIGENIDVFNQDLLVTGADSETTISLKNGAGAILGPNTMVRISFNTESVFGAINRFETVQVVSGNVIGKAGKKKLVIANKDQIVTVGPNTAQQITISKDSFLEKPKLNAVPVAVPNVPDLESLGHPTPLPSSSKPLETVKIQMISPLKEEYRVPNGSLKAVVNVKLLWKVDPADKKVRMTIWKSPLAQSGTNGEVQRTRVFQDVIGAESFVFSVPTPGAYTWEISSSNSDEPYLPSTLVGHFLVHSEFEAVRLLPIWVGGSPLDSNENVGAQPKNFSIGLRWEKYPEAKEYRIWIAKTENSSEPLLEKIISTPEYIFNKDKMVTSSFFYKVSAILENGFIAVSKLDSFKYEFLPPVLAVPKNNEVVKLKKSGSESPNLLMTWQKTKFTESYELEIAKDHGFSRIVMRKKGKENFTLVNNLGPGKYWWRVRSISTDLISPMSRPFVFEVVLK